jgi:hypothetical protein
MSALTVDPSVLEAYNDVRDDKTSTDWAVFGYDSDIGGSNQGLVRLQASGSDGINGLRGQLSPGTPAYGFLRVTSGDEMSKRPKFVFITWVPSDTKVMRKARISVHRAFVKEVVQDFACEITAEHLDELNEDVVMTQVQKAGGSNYGNSST